jgi:hypothetical protein
MEKLYKVGEKMNIEVNKVKIYVTIPEGYTEQVRNAICNAGAGVIGEYTFCTTSVKSIGTFIPSSNANPYIGKNNELAREGKNQFKFRDY